MDEEGLEGSRVPRVSDLTGLRSDATESIAVRSVDFDSSSVLLKSARLGYFRAEEQILIRSSKPGR
jgi:hypothetical protein